jgi:hypothetical protein
MSNDNEWISPSNTANVSNNNGTAFTVASIAATPEPLVVYAYSSSNVSKEAYSNLFPQDIIHYDPSLTYLDGTRTAKGFIVFRRDPIKAIECPYDWRNVRFKRWGIDPTGGDNPIPAMAVSTEYAIGDWAYHNNQIWLCIEDHTMGESINTEYFISMGFYQNSVNPLVLPSIGIEANYGAGVGRSGSRGGAGQAYYYPTFSNYSGTAFPQNQFGNIEITNISSNSILASQSHSLSFPNIVLRQSQFPSSIFQNIKITNSSVITIFGSGVKQNILIEGCNDINHINGTLNEIVFQNCSSFYTTTNQGGRNFKNLESCVNSATSALGVTINLIFENCINVTKTNQYCKTIHCKHSVDSDNFADHIGLKNEKNAKRLPVKEKTTVIAGSDRDVKIATNFISLPVLKYVDENNEQVIDQFYSDNELLHVQLNEGILDEIEGVADPAASLPLFSAQDHVTPSYTRNTSCWLNNHVEELTCISPWNSAYGNLFGCTAITPRHVLFAKHVTTPLTGATIRFITSDNQIVSKTILRTVVEPEINNDSGVALLDSDLPNTIHKAKLFPFNIDRYFPYIVNGNVWWPFSGLFYVDQDKKSIIGNWRLYPLALFNPIFLVRPYSPTSEFYQLNDDKNKYEFYEPIVTNDSGGPVFSVLNNELVLMGALTAGAASPPEEGGLAGAFYHKDGDVYNGLIAQVDVAEGISTGYTVNYVDLSSFAKVN